MRTALTIAGSDSGGGAGIQGDLATFAAHGVFGMTAVTAVTAQNSRGVFHVEPIAPDLVRQQIDVVVEDFPVHAVKIGMLARRATVEAVAAALARHALPHVVLDTVIRSSSGTPLLDDEAVEVMVRVLFPLASVVTANAPEAQALTGLPVSRVEDAREAAAALVARGARAAIVKGGHLEGPAVDVLFDGRAFVELSADRIDTRSTHGTGCAFASAIAARLALGDTLADAARAAKIYVTGAIAHAPRLGHGNGPLSHQWPREGA